MLRFMMLVFLVGCGKDEAGEEKKPKVYAEIARAEVTVVTEGYITLDYQLDRTDYGAETIAVFKVGAEAVESCAEVGDLVKMGPYLGATLEAGTEYSVRVCTYYPHEGYYSPGVVRVFTTEESVI